MSARILLVEDDPSIRRGIVDALAFEGFARQPQIDESPVPDPTEIEQPSEDDPQAD